jgi:hypothetical protein
MSRKVHAGHGRRISIWSAAFLLVLGGLAASGTVFAATSNDPLNPRPDLTDELIYYFDYAAADPNLIGPSEAYPFNKVTTVERIIEDRGPRGHHLINFDSTGDPNTIGEVDTNFTFTTISGESFALTGTRGFDTTLIGGITHDVDTMNHQDISDYGGYTFETFLKRTSSIIKIQVPWIPEGMHSLEILPGVLLAPPKTDGGNYFQFAARALGNIAIPVDDVLPVDEWVHVMAVMRVTQELPMGGDPNTDPLLAQYELYINGELFPFTDQKNTPLDPNDDEVNPVGPFDLNDSSAFSNLQKEHRHDGIGTQEFGSPIPGNREFAGEMAMTRLTYGVLTPAQSLCGCVAAPVENADFNGDDFVDGRDFLIWQRGSGVGTTASEGDANGDNMINGADLAIWESQYGGPPPLEAVATLVPEPTSLLLQLAGLAGLLGMRRRAKN